MFADPQPRTCSLDGGLTLTCLAPWGTPRKPRTLWVRPLNALHLWGREPLVRTNPRPLPPQTPYGPWLYHLSMSLFFTWTESPWPPQPCLTPALPGPLLLTSWKGVSLVTPGAQTSVLSRASGSGHRAGVHRGQGQSHGWQWPLLHPLLISQAVRLPWPAG